MGQLTKSLEFRNLPLLEAVTRVYFAGHTKLDFGLINDVQQSLGSDFQAVPPSIIEAQPSLEDPIRFTPGELPGVEYVNVRRLSIHLQPRLLAVRWRHAASEQSPPYPRYSVLRSTLETGLTRLTQLVPELPAAAIVNMTYLNFVRAINLIPFIERRYLPESVMQAKELQEFTVAWQAQDGTDLRYDLKRATRSAGRDSVDGVLLTTAAGSRLTQGDSALDRLDTLHSELQSLFSQLISQKAKDEWGLVSA